MTTHQASAPTSFPFLAVAKKYAAHYRIDVGVAYRITLGFAEVIERAEATAGRPMSASEIYGANPSDMAVSVVQTVHDERIRRRWMELSQ